VPAWRQASHLRRACGKRACHPGARGAYHLAATPPGRNDLPEVDSSRAHAIAVRLLWRAREPDGTLLLAHVRRVVARTPPEAHAVAWLHEVLETGAITEQELLAEGLTSDELRALRLLTRSGGSRSDSVYLEHLELIARAAGLSGHLARLVKLADLADRRSHPRRRPDGWAPPYARGYRLLREAEIAQTAG
jgi:hypothetical protein